MTDAEKIAADKLAADKAVADKAAADKLAAEAKPGPTGLDAFNADQLKEFYKRSPQMFEEAGIVAKKEEKKVEQEPPPKEKPQSAAPAAYEGVEIKLAEDVPVNKEVVARYLAHAKVQGLSAKQVQAEIDFQSAQYREALAAQPKPKTPQELQAVADAANVKLLREDKEFGEKYDENMEIARRAAVEFGDADLLERLRTSDPVLVKHLWKIGKANAEDGTKRAPNRTGNESNDEEKAEKDHLKARYTHPTSQGMFRE